MHELLIAAFLFIGAPVSALMLAQAAIRARLPSRAPLAEAGEDEERPG